MARGPDWKLTGYAREKRREVKQRQHRRDRFRALRAIGGKCVHCGISDPLVLQFDHINGQGDARRRREGRIRGSKGSSRSLICQILYGGIDRSTLQVLCANCHSRKTYAEKDYMPSNGASDKPEMLSLPLFCWNSKTEE